MNVYETAFTQLLKESGCTVRRYRTHLSGIAFTRADDWGIEVPMPTTPLRFGIAAHEVGHQMLHRFNSIPRWQEEWEAWDFALKQFDRFGLAGAEKCLPRVGRNLRYAARKAERRGVLPQRIEAVYPAWVWFA